MWPNPVKFTEGILNGKLYFLWSDIGRIIATKLTRLSKTHYLSLTKNCKHKWVNVFKNGPSKICVRKPLKNFSWSTLEYFVPNVL